MVDALEQFMEVDNIEVMISAIEHYSYCPRQCGLIHVEQTYDENVYTIRGNLAHERADSGEQRGRGRVREVRSIALWSERWGLRGKADVVEFHADVPYPIEYKVGKRLGTHADLQLCAQALCLEEMLGLVVPKGAVFYHATQKRVEVEFDAALRQRTIGAIEAIREMLRTQRLPDAPNDSRCRNCSLLQSCMPGVVGEQARLRGLQGTLFVPYGDDEVAANVKI